MTSVNGACLCGQIAYQIDLPFGPAFNCHCGKCRRWHGAAFRSRASVEASQFRWLRGEALLSRYDSSESVTKTFCSVCGSNLVSTYADRPNVIGVPLGGLEQHPGVTPQAHIFVGSKAPWHVIDDELPQFEEWPESEAAVRETKEKALAGALG